MASRTRDASKARDECASHLAGLDDDIMSYIIDMLEGDEDDSEVTESLCSFLLSTEHCQTEEEAAAKCSVLLEALRMSDDAAAAAEAAAPEASSACKLLDAKTSLADIGADEQGGSAFKHNSSAGWMADPNRAIEEAMKERKAERSAQVKATRGHYDRIRAQRKADDAALQKALEDAVGLRRQKGAFTGAVEAQPFDLPNPGGGTNLLEGATFTLVRGRVYGLIGRNGKGKSTLLRALASRQVGNIPPELTVHYVSQEQELSEESREMTPVDLVVHADLERRLLLADTKTLAESDVAEDHVKLSEVETRLEQIGAATAPERATELLIALGFTPELRGRQLQALSGGWRVRAALAAAIFARPDMLLLDEPTNHLSIAAVLWLARELTTSEVWKERIVVVVSHDRVFLDDVTDQTLHVSGIARQLTGSTGNYTTWAKRRRQQQASHEREMASRQSDIDVLRNFKPLGSTPKQMKLKMSKDKQAERLQVEKDKLVGAAATLQEDNELPLDLKAGGAVSGFIANIKGVSFRYSAETPTLFQGVELGIDSKSRIVLLGENGNGKTTLVKLLIGELEPTVGEVAIAGGTRIALVNQHHADQIDMTLSPLQFMLDKFRGDGSYQHEQKLRSHLNSCGVTSEMQTLPSSALSGGQRSRVALGAVSYTQPHILVLDEPTNNLDLESIASLADCIEKFGGGVVLVSHDQYFVSRVAKEVWVVEKGRVQRAASFDSYREAQLAKLK